VTAQPALQARLILADDHALVVEGMKGMLRQAYDIVGIAHSGTELLALLATTDADCLLLDLAMPGRNGLDLMPDIRALRPDMKVIVVTMHLDRVLAETVMHAGAHGFVPKDSGAEELHTAIRAVLAGERYMSPRVPRISNKVGLGAMHAGLAQLTPRQQQIVKLLGEGKTSAEIGRALGLSETTIVFHRQGIRKTLGITTEWELNRYAILVSLGGEEEGKAR
jgi:DNA-binding NarL/FixJ family response regulator